MILAYLPFCILPPKVIICQLFSFSVMKISYIFNPRLIQSCLIHDTPGQRNLTNSLKENISGKYAGSNWILEVGVEIRNISKMSHLNLEHILKFRVVNIYIYIFFRSPSSLWLYFSWMTTDMVRCMALPF